jgi:hypothetical protein
MTILHFLLQPNIRLKHLVRSWLRHYATSRKFPGSIPDCVIGYFSIDLILPAALWSLGSTQSPTEMSTRNFPGSKGRPARKPDKLTVICELIFERKCGSLNYAATCSWLFIYICNFNPIAIKIILTYLNINNSKNPEDLINFALHSMFQLLP